MNPARCESGLPLRSAHSMNKELTTVAKSIQRRDVKAGRVNRVALVLSFILLIALIGSIYANRYASGQTDIFTKVGYGASLQNSEILVNDELGITFLGTYQNTVLAFDSSENQIWQHEINGAISAMDFDTDKNWLIVGSQDRNIYVYEAATGTLVNTFSADGKVYDIDYDQASGGLLISAGVSASKHLIKVIDLNTGEEVLRESLKNTARSARFSPDGSAIYYGDNRARITKMDLTGETLAQEKARSAIRDLAVVEETGEVVALDETGNLIKMDADLNKLFTVEIVGEGRCVGVTDDGRWIAAGTREGDTHILDADGNIHFSNRQDIEVSQIYFGQSHCFVVTLSTDLYEFSAQRLDNIGKMASMKSWSLWAIIASAVLLAVALIVTFPRSRDLGKRFFVSMHRHRTAYLMLLPSIALILIFNYYNVFQAFYYAFTDWSLSTRTMREVNFIGLDNFRKMITEGYFLLGVKNLVIIMLCSFAKLLTIPVLLAELVFAMRTLTGKSSKRRYWFRLLLVIPMVVPGVVSTLMWKNIFDPNIGALNSILDVIGKSSWKHSWLGDPSTALWAIIFMGFPWVNSFAFLVFYGGLINIPEDLFEAAKVDGSNPAWNFFHIHLPLISPQLKMLIITTFIGAVQDYGGVLLLTSGGPGYTTYVPGLELYFAATKFGQYGYACAMGLVMFIVILIGSLLNLRIKTQDMN